MKRMKERKKKNETTHTHTKNEIERVIVTVYETRGE
jgi:hypothetical protein